MYPCIAGMLAEYGIEPFAEMPSLAVCKSFDAAVRATSCHTPYYGTVISTPDITELHAEMEALHAEGFPADVSLILAKGKIEVKGNSGIDVALLKKAEGLMHRWQDLVAPSQFQERTNVHFFNTSGQYQDVMQPHIDGGTGYILTTRSTTQVFAGLFSSDKDPGFPSADSPYVSTPVGSALMLDRKWDETEKDWLAVPHRGGPGSRLTMNCLMSRL